MTDGLLGAVKQMLGLESTSGSDSVYEYDGWTCPHCGLGLASSAVKNTKTGVEQKSKHCGWCGWSASSDPDRSPHEAHERARLAHKVMGHMHDRATDGDNR